MVSILTLQVNFAITVKKGSLTSLLLYGYGHRMSRGSYAERLISRPRRFGKSFAAKENVNSTYSKYLNKFDVIYLDMTNIIGKTEKKNAVTFIEDSVTEELQRAYSNLKTGNTFDEKLINATEITGNKFIMIIDEWDAPIRETPEIEKIYLEFLRTLFKSSGTTDKIFAAAYMTGILPIKKDGSESAISDFWEYSMMEPGPFQSYVGFTELEVNQLCQEYHMNFAEAKRWYDGYSFDNKNSIYNPYSIMKAITMKKYRSYWRMSSAADALEDYIAGDYDGLFGAILELLGGFSLSVNTSGFNNDITSVKNRDDVLTLLIHLGYLAYNDEDGTIRIPNEEIRMEFAKAVREVKV